MEKKYNPNEYNNATKCEVCGNLTFSDDYGNTDKCPHCGWKATVIVNFMRNATV